MIPAKRICCLFAGALAWVAMALPAAAQYQSGVGGNLFFYDVWSSSGDLTSADLERLGPDGVDQSIAGIDKQDSLLLAASLVGDANLDGTTDAFDFAALAANFSRANNIFNLVGVDAFDFSALSANFNQVYAERIPVPATPEPATAALLGLASVSLITRRRP